MPLNVTQKLIESHRTPNEAGPAQELALGIDQTLTQDATGTLVMLELEALGLDRVKTELSVQYVDHNLLQEDYKNADDHLFLHSACRRYGVWFSRPGNGVSHPLHMQHFGAPGKSMLGSDSHTCAAGAIGMLAMGAGGLDVAMAMAGRPFRIKMPEVWGVHVDGELPPWVSAKDVILELLRRHGVSGGLGRVIEYHGPGLSTLDVWDRHVIANMGAELGATTTVFPADEQTRRFFEHVGRQDDFRELGADPGATYDHEEHLDLSRLEPLIAKPSSPGNVVPVREVAGTEIYQVYIGSSANPAYRDFAISARMVEGRQMPVDVSYDINPSSRQVVQELAHEGLLANLLDAGARMHQPGCNGCIGMGQAPATGRNSLRTVPRNFPGRSGTKEDSVWLCSPETATASGLKGVITDPRELGMDYPSIEWPPVPDHEQHLFLAPAKKQEAKRFLLVKGPNISSLPELDPLPERAELPVMLKVGDDISTDEILPAGARVLPYRSNIQRIADFAFEAVDDDYPRRAREHGGPHVVVGGKNYGQGSSREHAALAPRSLGLRLVIAKTFARIHWQNLISFGVLPLRFADPSDYDTLDTGQRLTFENLHDALRAGSTLEAARDGQALRLQHDLSPRQIETVIRGGLINAPDN